MKIWRKTHFLGCCFLFLGVCLWGQGADFELRSKIFAYGQALGRKHIEQMRFDSIYDWQTWGITHLSVRKNFIGADYMHLVFAPQIAIDRSYALSNGKLIIGADIDVGGGIGGERSGAGFGEYGIGGYLLYRTLSDCYLSAGLRFAQGFSARNPLLDSYIWTFDIGAGKRFELPAEYFIDADFRYAMGLISGKSSGGLHLESNIPFNLLASVGFGKQIGKHWFKVSLTPLLDMYAMGKIMKQTNAGLEVKKPSADFDILFSISYDLKLTPEFNFFSYADFHSLRFEMMLGAGVRLTFGENKSRSLRYPKIKLKKLKKTYLK